MGPAPEKNNYSTYTEHWIVRTRNTDPAEKKKSFPVMSAPRNEKKIMVRTQNAVPAEEKNIVGNRGYLPTYLLVGVS